MQLIDAENIIAWLNVQIEIAKRGDLPIDAIAYYGYALAFVKNLPTVKADIDRAAILRLCNEIDDILTLLYTYCHIDHYQYNQIHSKLDAIGKELNGDAGTDD